MSKQDEKKKTGPKPGCPKTPGSGRQKGTPNKTTALLKDAILKAAEQAGNKISDDGEGGTVAYLEKQAVINPGPFMALLGKVLPTQLLNDPENPLTIPAPIIQFSAPKDS